MSSSSSSLLWQTNIALTSYELSSLYLWFGWKFQQLNHCILNNVNSYLQKAITNIIAMKPTNMKHSTVSNIWRQLIKKNLRYISQSFFYTPYHPRARKMFKSLQKKTFGINCVFKKRATLGNYLSKEGPKKTNEAHRMYYTLCHVKIRTTNILDR